MTTPHRKPTPRKAKRKANRIKAKLFWANPNWNTLGYLLVASPESCGMPGMVSIAVIDVSDVDALIEQAARETNDPWFAMNGEVFRDEQRANARCVLESLGIIKRKHLPAIQAKRGKKTK